jgi:hypothetical protein
MEGEVLRALAKAGLDAQWIGVVVAGEATILTLCLVIAFIVGMVTDNENTRQFCYAIICKILEFFHDVLEFFHDVLTRRGGK